MSGFFLVHRGWMDSFKPEPFTEREAFLWSVEMAAFQAHDQWFNGHRIMVERGEFVTSLREMEKAFGWSLKRVRGFLDRMGKAQKWAQRRAYYGAQSPTILTVCNYAVYQNPGEAMGTVEGTAKGTRRAQSGHSKGTQQKEGNKGNKIEERPSVSSPEAGEGAGSRIDPPVSLSLVPDVDQVGNAFDAYDALRREIVPAARAVHLTVDRRRKLAARLDEIGGIDVWGDVLASIRGSPFLQCENRTGRLIATIDWLLEPKNLRKVLEGNFNDSPSASAFGGPRVRGGAFDTVLAARAILGRG